jgi:sugar O-acyltransferase (sialic acid O-acetyltransferase NeuD family)
MNIILIGAGGHAKVVADIVIKSEGNLLGFLDDNLPAGHLVIGYPILGKISEVSRFANDDTEFIIAVGNNATRAKLAETLSLPWHTAIHPNATIGTDVEIGKGSVIMSAAVINPCASIGKHCIINSGAIIEHDNILADYVHVSPGACLGGTVHVGEHTHIGIGATVRNNITITANCVIGAGATVVKDITVPGIYIGTPARIA